MPFRGLFGIFGSDDTQGVQQLPGDAIRNPNSDNSQQLANHIAQQQSQVTANELARQQQAASINSLYGTFGQAEQAIMNHDTLRAYQQAFITYDLSDKTTLAMCEIVKKATEKLWLK
jgi:capsule polysaccharide export protein KpsE/RkpR